MTSWNLLGKNWSLCAGPVRKPGATVDWALRGTCGMSGGLGWASVLECRCWRRISMRSSQSGRHGWWLCWWWSFTMSRLLESCSSVRRRGSKCTISITPLTCELHTYIVISRYLACSLQIQTMIFRFAFRCWICQRVSRRSLLHLTVPWRAFLANLSSSSGENLIDGKFVAYATFIPITFLVTIGKWIITALIITAIERLRKLMLWPGIVSRIVRE